jgi:bacillithiol system protein YtxJ
MAKNQLERNAQPEITDFYYLDLIKHRSISNKIAEDFAVQHQSPQVLLIKNMECVYEESHSEIEMDDIAAQILAN